MFGRLANQEGNLPDKPIQRAEENGFDLPQQNSTAFSRSLTLGK